MHYMHCFSFPCWVKACGGFRKVFFICWSKKVVACPVSQVVVLYRNNCMGIGIGSLNDGHLG